MNNKSPHQFTHNYKGWQIFKDNNTQPPTYYARRDGKTTRPRRPTTNTINNTQCAGRGQTLQSIKNEINYRVEPNKPDPQNSSTPIAICLHQHILEKHHIFHRDIFATPTTEIHIYGRTTKTAYIIFTPDAIGLIPPLDPNSTNHATSIPYGTTNIVEIIEQWLDKYKIKHDKLP